MRSSTIGFTATRASVRFVRHCWEPVKRNYGGHETTIEVRRRFTQELCKATCRPRKCKATILPLWRPTQSSVQARCRLSRTSPAKRLGVRRKEKTLLGTHPRQQHRENVWTVVGSADKRNTLDTPTSALHKYSCLSCSCIAACSHL
jgi:hypothetical protein